MRQMLSLQVFLKVYPTASDYPIASDSQISSDSNIFNSDVNIVLYIIELFDILRVI